MFFVSIPILDFIFSSRTIYFVVGTFQIYKDNLLKSELFLKYLSVLHFIYMDLS